MKNEHEKKVAMATEIGRLLPETKEKVSFYSEIIQAKNVLISEYQKRQSNYFISKINKAKEKIEIVKLKNELIQQERVYNSYLERKHKYEDWLDEMSIEVQNELESTIKRAKEITYNPRLQDGISKFESLMEKNTLQDNVEFYLFLKQEILNHEEHKNKKKIR